MMGFALSQNAMAEFKYTPPKQPIEAPNPNLIIQSNNAKFADQYPKQFNSWAKTSESTDLVSVNEEDPRTVVLWAGYAFAKDYKKPRGHFYTVTDVRNILRTGAPGVEGGKDLQPMACWTCKGPDVPRLIAEWGEEGYFSGPWSKGGAEVVNSIGCADCHDTTSKAFARGEPALRIARPHVLRALEKLGKPFDKMDNTDKRAAACGNCHVEYYFADSLKQVTFPWDKGVDADSIEKYYDEIGFTDWTHAISKAQMLKAQHPDYETWSMGIHGKNGVTCIDCHMPKVKDADGKVYTDHKIGNPFDAFESTCANCHDQEKETLKNIVKTRKSQIKDVMLRLEDQLVKAHFEAKAAWDAGANKEEMNNALVAIRHAQWRWDYSAAGHGGQMHAPEVILHVLGTGLDRVTEARTELARILAKHGVNQPVQIPDISTADKAWKATGVDIEKERKLKAEFIKTVVPQWEKEAQEKGLIPKN
nr:ammonia-forming nitrite reductase cytochrome c552 subunit [Cricetibacter osteomyelitidis]